MKTLFEPLLAHAKTRPEHLALVDGARALTYGQFLQRSASVAEQARALGIEKGHKVLLMQPLGIDFFVLFMGLMRIGAVGVLIDPSQPRKVVAQCVENVRPDVFMGIRRAHFLRLMPTLRVIPKAVATDGFSWVADSIDPNSEAQPTFGVQIDAEDAALITFTSGSTGRPKTIVRSHAFLIHQHQAVQKVLRPREGDVELSTLPVFILSNLGAGITSVIPLKDYNRPHKMKPSLMADYAREKGVNRILAAPAFLARLSEADQPLETVTQVFTGGGPVFPNLLRRLKDLFPRAETTLVYGSSEAEPIAHIGAQEIEEADQKRMQAGYGLLAGHWDKDISLRIISPEAKIHGAVDQLAFANIEMAQGEVGEIVVSGDHVIKSYLNPLDNAQSKFCAEGIVWHRTGDAGYIDTQNRLWLMGRVNARIVHAPKVLYPFALEAAIMCHDEVIRAAAIGKKDEVTVAIETKKPLDILALNRLKASHPAISRLVTVKSIPVDKRHHSKVLYTELARRLGL